MIKRRKGGSGGGVKIDALYVLVFRYRRLHIIHKEINLTYTHTCKETYTIQTKDKSNDGGPLKQTEYSPLPVMTMSAAGDRWVCRRWGATPGRGGSLL